MKNIVRAIQTPLKDFAMSTYDLIIEKGIEKGVSIKERDFATSLIRAFL